MKTGPTLLCLLASLVLFFSVAFPVQASRPGEDGGQNSPVLPQGTYRALEEIHTLMDNGSVDQARKNLLRLLDRVEKRPYEKAVVMRTLGYLHVSASDYAEAARCFEQALAEPLLPEGLYLSTQYDLAQIYMSLDDVERSIKTLEGWFVRATAPSAEAYLLLGSGYAQLQKFREAITPLRQAIKLANKPKESWYRLLLAAHYEVRDEEACIRLLEEMIRHFPEKKEFWQQAASLLLSRNENWRALSILESAHRQGLLTESSEVLNLVRLYAYLELPYKGALTIEEALKTEKLEMSPENLELLSELWLQARETRQAAVALEKTAQIKASGKAYLRLGQIHYGAGNWQDASVALEKALAIETADREGEAWLLLGMSRYELDQRVQAKEAFEKAERNPRVREAAQQWLAFLALSNES